MVRNYRKQRMSQQINHIKRKHQKILKLDVATTPFKGNFCIGHYGKLYYLCRIAQTHNKEISHVVFAKNGWGFTIDTKKDLPIIEFNMIYTLGQGSLCKDLLQYKNKRWQTLNQCYSDILTVIKRHNKRVKNGYYD